MKLMDELRATHDQDGGIVLDIRSGRMFRLNPVGSRILELLRAGLEESEITQQVSREFHADRETVASDVKEFLAHLEAHRLVEDREPEPHAAA